VIGANPDNDENRPNADVSLTPRDAAPARPIRSFVAMGDSFTEGLSDATPDGRWAGWADRLADRLAELDPALTYANIAIRGKLLDQIVDGQLDTAIALAPDLVGFSAGGNDILRPGSDPDDVAARYEAAVIRLRGAGAQVLTFTGSDPRGVPVLQMLRGKIATFNEHLRLIAAREGCVLVDLWAMPALHDRRAWGADRLHLSAAGHAQVALLAAHALGMPVESDPFAAWPEQAPRSRSQLRRENIAWTREHLLPWVGRRLRGRSSGDGLSGKRPDLAQWQSKSA
jgi:lysophospholipase L1-like esterase